MGGTVGNSPQDDGGGRNADGDDLTRVCVCVFLLYSVQLGGQRSPLSTTGHFGFPSTQLTLNKTPQGHPRVAAKVKIHKRVM